MPYRILVCDDQNHITRLVELVLKREGYSVLVEHDGLSAWEHIQQDPPDLLITDHEMPGLTGLELVENIRNLNPVAQLPVILLSARAFELMESQVVRDLKLPNVLMKPFSPRELTVTVKRILATPQIPNSRFERVVLATLG